MKIKDLAIVFSGVLLLQGCSAFDKHHGINWGEGHCPAPAAETLSSGNLRIEDGKTLKCQLKPYVSNMACQGITDKTNADGVLCQNGLGQNMLFVFDEKGVLQRHGSL